MDFLSKLYTKIIFSEDSTLNLVPRDLGEEMITGSISEGPVKRLPTATGTIGSLNIAVAVTLNVSILKTSPTFEKYWNRILTNGYIGGTATFYDDANNSYTISEVSLSFSDFPSANGSKPDVTFVVEGNLFVNKQAIAGF